MKKRIRTTIFRKSKIRINVNIYKIFKLVILFKRKKWLINKGPGDFERCCKLLALLDDEQQELIFELLKRYLMLPAEMSFSLLNKVVAKIDKNYLNKYDKIYVLPLKPRRHYDKLKSSDSLLYFFKSRKITEETLAGKKLEIYQVPKNNIPTDFDKSRAVLFLVDDFIGTGETAMDTINDIHKQITISKDNIMVLSLAAQERGADVIQRAGYIFYTAHLIKRGISDFYDTISACRKKDIMIKIEKIINTNKDSLGYKESEALITLIRTPDNTFPVFWDKTILANKEPYVAPFVRNS